MGKSFKKEKLVIADYALTKIIIQGNTKHRSLFVLLGMFLTGRGIGTCHLSTALNRDAV